MKMAFGILLAVVVSVGCSKNVSPSEDDAFAIIGRAGDVHRGMFKPGLDTIIAKATSPSVPEVTATIYWSKAIGLMIKVVSDGAPGQAMQEQLERAMVDIIYDPSVICDAFKSIRDNYTGTVSSGTLHDGINVINLAFSPKDDTNRECLRYVAAVMPDGNNLKQYGIISKESETVCEIEYTDGLPMKITRTITSRESIVSQTFRMLGQYYVLVTAELVVLGNEGPSELTRTTFDLSDIQINAKIPDEISAMAGGAQPGKAPPLPKATAAELVAQAKSAYMRGDKETAILKLKEILTDYPNDPLAKEAGMALKMISN